jgi:hypothetical protein
VSGFDLREIAEMCEDYPTQAEGGLEWGTRWDGTPDTP